MSEIKVNKLSPRSGTTVTLGDSGDTITIPSGVTLSTASFSSTGIDDNATSTAITIDSSERVLINQTSSISGGGVTGSLQLSGTNFNNSSVSFSNFGNDANPSILAFNKSRSGVVGTTGTIVQNGDNVGNINWNADDGTNLGSNLARISGQIDGVPGENDTPGRLVFYTTADGAASVTERMRIDSSGNVGISTSSPVAPLTVASGSATGAISLGGDVSSTGITNNTRKLGRLVTPSYSTAEEPVALILADFDGSDNQIVIGGGGGDLNASTKILFNTASNTTTTGGTEAMRIDASSRVMIDTTSAFSSARLTVNAKTGSVHPVDVRVGVVSDGFSGIIFRNPNGIQGSIAINSTSVSYNTSSDYRLKENVVDLTNATERLKQLQPKRFNFIANADTTVDGFLAHEVSSVVPEAISGTHNEVEVWKEGEELPEGVSVGDNKLDGEGNTIPVYQGIDQAKLVPLLVKTIQELEARITTLENA
jgi:hypothetical protein